MRCEIIEKDRIWSSFPLLHKLLGGCKFPDNYLGLPVVSSHQISYLDPGVALSLLVKSESSIIIQAVRKNPEIGHDLYEEIYSLSAGLKGVGEAYLLESSGIADISEQVMSICAKQDYK